MSRRLPPHLLLSVALLTGLGCTLAEVKVDVVSERTSLENQVLGTYNALDDEMLLVASVRGVDAEGAIRTPPPRSQEAQDAVLALQTLAFHADDLESFLRLGWAGERRDGLLEAFALTRGGPEDLAEFVQRYTDAEFRAVLVALNTARSAVMERVVAVNADLSAADLPAVRQVFGELNIANAPAATRIEQANGVWAVKP